MTKTNGAPEYTLSRLLKRLKNSKSSINKKYVVKTLNHLTNHDKDNLDSSLDTLLGAVTLVKSSARARISFAIYEYFMSSPTKLKDYQYEKLVAGFIDNYIYLSQAMILGDDIKITNKHIQKIHDMSGVFAHLSNDDLEYIIMTILNSYRTGKDNMVSDYYAILHGSTHKATCFHLAILWYLKRGNDCEKLVNILTQKMNILSIIDVIESIGECYNNLVDEIKSENEYNRGYYYPPYHCNHEYRIGLKLASYLKLNGLKDSVDIEEGLGRLVRVLLVDDRHFGMKILSTLPSRLKVDIDNFDIESTSRGSDQSFSIDVIANLSTVDGIKIKFDGDFVTTYDGCGSTIQSCVDKLFNVCPNQINMGFSAPLPLKFITVFDSPKDQKIGQTKTVKDLKRKEVY